MILSLLSGAHKCSARILPHSANGFFTVPFIVTKYCESIPFRNVFSRGHACVFPCMLFIQAYSLQSSES